MTLSVLCAILSVAGGFVPFWAVYEILLLFINRTATLNNIMLWCLVGVGGYLIRVICFGISTILAHISAYTILEGIRLKIANRLMRAPLGEVMGRRIGYLKNIIMDKVEDLEPPLAHMIPELTSNLLLPVAIFIWLLAIDWRLGLAVLIAPVLAMIPMFFLMRNYNSQYAAYMEANNHVNNVIIEYVEGIEVVKAFNQSTSSYEKFVGAVKSFKDFTLAWFKSTWKTMNLMMAIMPTTLLGVLPIGLLLTQSGSITPAELAMGIILSLSIVGPLMKATTFINEAKSMEYAVEAANELLNLPVLPDSGKIVPIRHTDIVLQDVSFSYDGTEQNEVLLVRQFRYPYKEVLLELPAGKLEKGEDPFEAVKREQMEETGTTGENYISLGNLYPSPGYCGEIIRIWACRVAQKGEMHLDEDEFLEVERIPLDKAVEMVLNNEIPDSKTQVGILKTAALVKAGKL